MIASQVMSTLKSSNSPSATFHRVHFNGCASSSIRMSLFFSSSSSSSAWNAMFNKLKSQTLNIKPIKETRTMDGVLSKCAVNDKYVSLFTDAADKDQGLRQWIYEQRRRYKMCDQKSSHAMHEKKSTRNRLTQEQIDLLNGMNFIWNAKECIWDFRLNELREFRKKHGHCVVPQRHNYIHFPKLGMWVKEVRKRKRNQEKETPSRGFGFLTVKQIADLDNLNFVWDALEATWFEKFNDLTDFYRKNGHTQVTDSNCIDKSLVSWVNNQRQFCKDEKKIKLLNSMEFIWSVSREDQWLEKFHEVKDFFEEHGHAKVTKHDCTSKSLLK